MPRQKNQKQKDSTPRGRVARRLKGYTGQVSDLGNQLTAVRERLQMLETGETEPYLAAITKRQTELEDRMEKVSGTLMQKVDAQDAKIAEQNSVIGGLIDRIDALEKGD